MGSTGIDSDAPLTPRERYLIAEINKLRLRVDELMRALNQRPPEVLTFGGLQEAA